MRVQQGRYAPRLAAVATIAALLATAGSAAADLPTCCCTHADDDVAPDPHPLGLAVTAGPLVGVRWLDLGAVSALVARYGYAPLPATAVVAGGDLYATGGRVRFGFEAAGGGRSAGRPRGRQKLPATSFDAAVLLGYEVLGEGDGSVFVSTGFGGGDLQLNTTSMDGFVHLHDGEYGVTWSYVGMPLQLGAEDFLRIGKLTRHAVWVLRVGVRATWFQQFDGGWSTLTNDQHKSARDLSGPPLDLSGPSVLLTLGFGAAAVSSD